MILTVSHDDSLKERVATGLAGSEWSMPVSAVHDVEAALDHVQSRPGPHAVVVGADIGVQGAARIAARAAVGAPTPVFLVADAGPDVLRAAMRAGVRDVLPVAFGATDLVGAFEEAGVRSGSADVVPGLTVSVFSSKGGVGTSVLAANLAVRLSDRTSAATTLVDLDLASADQAILHGLSPRWTVQELADGTIGLDEEALGQVLLDIPGTSNKLLPGPVDPALAETISASSVSALIAAVRAVTSIAVLDTGAGFDDRTLAALDASDVIVVATSLDVAALRALTVSLQTMRRLGIKDENVLVALVRADSKTGLLVDDVERAIDRPIDIGIPSTRLVPRSVNEGVPIAIQNPRAPVVAAIDELAGRLLDWAPEEMRGDDGDGDAKRGRSSLFSWGRSSSSSADATPGPPPPISAPGAGTSTVDDGGDGSAAALEDDPTPQEGPADEGAGEADDAAVRSFPTRVRPLHRPAAEDEADGQPITSPEGDVEQAEPTPRAVRRPRPVPVPELEDDDAGDDAVDGSVPDPEPDEDGPQIKAVPPLSSMPPPTLAADDDDDQKPRRRRRR